MSHLPDLECMSCPPRVPSILSLAMAATALFWLPENFAEGSERDLKGSEAGSQARNLSLPPHPQSMMELRRQLIEMGQLRRGEPRQGPESVLPQGPRARSATFGDHAFGPLGSPLGNSLGGTPAVFLNGLLRGFPAGFAAGLAGDYSAGSVAGTAGGHFTGPAAGPVHGPVFLAPERPAVSPPAGPAAAPSSQGLSRLSSRQTNEPIQLERRQVPEGGAGLRLSDAERALLRQQLRERPRNPAARENR